MALNARRQTIPAAADATVSSDTIFKTFGLSVHDVVPVLSQQDQAQLVLDMQAQGAGPSASNPLLTLRADADPYSLLEVTYDGVIWKPAVPKPTDTGWANLVLSTGWTAVSGHTPRTRVVNGMFAIEGAVLRGAGGNPNNIGTVVPAHRWPSGKTVFLGASVASLSGGAIGMAEVFVSGGGVIRVDGYNSIGANAGSVIPLTATVLFDE